ncbi:uncharacterized protein KGF55_001376 [Candida pseudojiufengensis]|uniref:uncharacterized protein n=1 Tax=Candida pseudojiufengensis TaxID=497109 RepID=UPI0022249566|nr:uncharacterized protein KGF55_001376 [Candida pseudojiufengensis]KAI5965156.1 hypothetical protein KGF55_001376 [Candida pseudojiufengensis]
MSTYEEEHNITPTPNQERNRNHNTLSEIIDSFVHSNSHTNHHNHNLSHNHNNSENIASTTSIESLTAALNQLRTLEHSELANSLINILETEPKQEGVTSEFLDTLERIPISKLSDDEFCPICTNKFKDDSYPLVVKLPCGYKIKHYFDLECISPWLIQNSTCPICRTNVLEIEKNRKKLIEEEIQRAKELDSESDEEDGWDIYG